MKNLIIVLTLAIFSASCVKTETPQPSIITEVDTESIRSIEGNWNAEDDCSFWVGENIYPTNISQVEYNIVELTNILNLESSGGKDGTMHASVVNNEIIIPAQSYMDDRYQVSGLGTLSEDGESLTISLEVLDSEGELVDGCDITLVK